MLWSAPRSRFARWRLGIRYLDKIGFASQYEIFTAVSQLTGREPVVVDSAGLVIRPAAAAAIKAYCARVGIDFRPEAQT